MLGSEFEIVGHEQNGAFFVLKFDDEFGQLPPEGLVLPGRGFIEDDQFGFDCKGCCKSNPLLLTLAQRERRSLEERDKSKTGEELMTPGWIIGTNCFRSCQNLFSNGGLEELI